MIDPKLLADLEAAHGRIGVVTAKNGAWEVVLRKPSRAEYKMFRSLSHNAQKLPEAQEQLFGQTCVYPADRAAREVLLDEWPGIPEACGQMLIDLAGMSGIESGK
jgi:hypothetical protein